MNLLTLFAFMLLISSGNLEDETPMLQEKENPTFTAAHHHEKMGSASSMTHRKAWGRRRPRFAGLKYNSSMFDIEDALFPFLPSKKITRSDHNITLFFKTLQKLVAELEEKKLRIRRRTVSPVKQITEDESTHLLWLAAKAYEQRTPSIRKKSFWKEWEVTGYVVLGIFCSVGLALSVSLVFLALRNIRRKIQGKFMKDDSVSRCSHSGSSERPSGGEELMKANSNDETSSLRTERIHWWQETQNITTVQRITPTTNSPNESNKLELSPVLDLVTFSTFLNVEHFKFDPPRIREVQDVAIQVENDLHTALEIVMRERNENPKIPRGILKTSGRVDTPISLGNSPGSIEESTTPTQTIETKFTKVVTFGGHIIISPDNVSPISSSPSIQRASKTAGEAVALASPDLSQSLSNLEPSMSSSNVSIESVIFDELRTANASPMVSEDRDLWARHLDIPEARLLLRETYSYSYEDVSDFRTDSGLATGFRSWQQSKPSVSVSSPAIMSSNTKGSLERCSASTLKEISSDNGSGFGPSTTLPVPDDAEAIEHFSGNFKQQKISRQISSGFAAISENRLLFLQDNQFAPTTHPSVIRSNEAAFGQTQYQGSERGSLDVSAEQFQAASPENPSLSYHIVSSQFIQIRECQKLQGISSQYDVPILPANDTLGTNQELSEMADKSPESADKSPGSGFTSPQFEQSSLLPAIVRELSEIWKRKYEMGKVQFWESVVPAEDDSRSQNGKGVEDSLVECLSIADEDTNQDKWYSAGSQPSSFKERQLSLENAYSSDYLQPIDVCDGRGIVCYYDSHHPAKETVTEEPEKIDHMKSSKDDNLRERQNVGSHKMAAMDNQKEANVNFTTKYETQVVLDEQQQKDEHFVTCLGRVAVHAEKQVNSELQNKHNIPLIEEDERRREILVNAEEKMCWHRTRHQVHFLGNTSVETTNIQGSENFEETKICYVKENIAAAFDQRNDCGKPGNARSVLNEVEEVIKMGDEVHTHTTLECQITDRNDGSQKKERSKQDEKMLEKPGMKDEKLELKFCESPCSSSSNTFEVKRTRKQRSESNSFKEGSEECDFKARETCTRVYICHRMESSGEEHSEEIEEKSQTLSTPETIIGESPSRTNDREPGSHGTSTTSDGKDMVTLLSPRFLKSLGDLEHLLKPTYQHHDISQESTSITVFEESTAVPLKDTDARVSVSNSARSGTLASLECHNSVHISGLELEPNSFVRILEREESVGTELEMFETVQKPYYCDDLKPIFVEGVPIMTCSFPFLECTVPESEFSLATEYRQAQVINAAIGFKNGLCVMGLPIEDLTKNILATSNVFEGPPSYDSDALIFCWKSTRPLPGDDDDLTKYFQLPGMHEVNVSDSFQNPDLTFRLHSETKPIQHFKPHHEDRQCFQSFHRIIHQVPTTQEDNFCSTLTEKIEDKNERVHIEEGNLRRTAPHSSKIRQCQNVVVREDSMIDVHALTEVNHSQGTKRSGIHTQTYQEDVNSSRETTTQKQEEGVSVPKEEIIEDNGYNECSRKSKLTKHKEPKDSEENYKTSESRTNTASKSSKGSYSTKCSSSKSKHVSDESSKGDEQPAAFEQEHFLRTRIAHHDEMQLRYQEIRKHPGQTHTMKRIHPCQYEIGKTIHRDIDSESFHPRDLEVENQIPGNEHIERDNVKISMIRPSFDHSDQSSHTEQGTVEHNQQPNEKQRFQEHARHHRKMENEHHEREPRDMQNWDQSHFTMQEHTPREATEPSNTDIGLDALFTCEKPLSRQNNVEHQREDSVSKQKSTTSIHNEVGDSKAHEHMREKEKTIFQYDMEYCQLQTKKSMLHQKEAESHEVSAHQVRQTNFQFEYEKHEHEYYGHEVKTGEQGDQPQVVIETVRETCLLVEAEKVVHTEQRTSDQTLLQCAVQDQETWTVKILETRDERGEVIPQQSGFEPELPETSRERGPTSESEIPEKIQTNEQSETSVSSREIQENVCMKSGDAGSGTEVMDQTPVWIQNTKDSYLKEGQKNVSDHERSHCTKSFQGSSSEFGTNITTYSDPTDPEDDMNLLHSKDRGGEWLTMVLEEESNNEDETESMAQGNDLTSGGKEHIVVEVSASMREVETDNRMESSGSTSEGIGESDMNLIMAQVRLLRNHISSVTGEFMMPPIAEHPNSISFVEGETSGSDLNQEGECEESLEENEEEVSEEVIISADNDDPDQNADLSEVQGEHEREMSTPELLQEAFSIDEVPMGHFLQNTPQRRQTYSDALSAQIDDTRQQELTTKKLRNTKSTMTNQSNRKEPERADGVGALNPSQQEANPNLRESVHGAGEIQSERASQSMDLCSSEQSAGDSLFSDSLLLAPERNGSYPSMCSDSKIFFHRTPQHTENNLASEYNKTDNRTVTRTDIFGKSAIGASYPERVEDVTTSDGKVGPQTITVTEVTGRKTMMTSLWHFQSVKSPAHANEFEGEREEAAITNDTELVSGNDRFKTYQHRSNQKRIVRSSVHSSKKANLESFQLSELPSLFDRTEEEFRSTPFHQLELTSSTATSELHLSSISSNDSASNEFTENIQTTDLMIEVDELGSPSSPEPREPRVNTKKNTETMLDNPSSLRLVLEEFSIEMESEDDESIGSQERNQKLKQRQNQVVLEIDALSFRDESEQASREKSSNRSSSMSKSAAA